MKTCGDFGGRKLDGSLCTRKAAWGIKEKTEGPCRDHTAAAEAKLAADKERFLEQLSKGTVSLTAAARDIGKDQATVWRWRQADPDFDADVKEALHERDQIRVELVEDSLFKRLVAGTAAAAEMVFFLANRAPHRWRHVQHIQLTGKDGAPFALRHEVHLYLPDNGRDGGDSED